MKKIVRTAAKLLTFATAISALVACGNDSAPQEIKSLEAGDALNVLSGVKFDTEHAFFDDFTNGVSYDNWIIGNGAWGEGNGGIVPDNVSYTDDGILLLRGNGLYYSKNDIRGVGSLKDGRNTGSGLISKFKTGPGRYEIKMKPLGRKGACTAFWTYANRLVDGEDNDNHEIDIELPGGKEEGTISFDHVLNTNYTKEKEHISVDVNLKNVTKDKVIHLNDGKFHTFGFDWYTNPGYMVYFIDGIVTNATTDFIPNLQTRLWVANWFPNNTGFVGNSEFETDYMEVDWVKYLPFDNTQTYEAWDATVTVNPAAISQYPSTPTIKPEVNIVSNGDFEYVNRREEVDRYGWRYSRFNTEKRPLEQVCYASKDEGVDGSAAAKIVSGGYLSQEIDSLCPGSKIKISFDAKSTGTDSKVGVGFKSLIKEDAGETLISIEGSGFSHYEKTIDVPENGYTILLRAFNEGRANSESNFTLDNLKITRVF